MAHEITAAPSRATMDMDVEKAGEKGMAMDESGQNSREGSSTTLSSGEVMETEDYPEPAPIEKTETNLAKRVLTKISTKSSWRDPGPPPDGGFKAWLQCGMGVLIVTTTWGFINSFGVFQAFYVDFLDRPPSDIAWIGSIQVFLLFFVGSLTGRVADAGYFKQIVAVGSILQLLGIFMASISTQYWQIFLSQGVCVGLANGCIFTPGVALVSTYFSTKKSLAIGIAASGSAVGGLIFPVMVQKLLPEVGFGWTMRALGLVDGILLLTINVFARQRVPPRRSGAFLDLAAFKDPTYLLYGIGMFFTFWGVYFAFFYLSAFARTDIGFQQEESINVLLVLNGVGIIGRVVPNHLADRYYGPLNLMLIASSVSAIVVYCLSAVKSKAGTYVWAVAYGIVGAAIQSLFPAVLGSLTGSDLKKAGVRMGMIFTIVSFAVLTGPPIAGVLISKADGGYLYAEMFAASSIMVGCALMCAARIARTGWKLRVKM